MNLRVTFYRAHVQPIWLHVKRSAVADLHPRRDFCVSATGYARPDVHRVMSPAQHRSIAAQYRACEKRCDLRGTSERRELIRAAAQHERRARVEAERLRLAAAGAKVPGR